MGFHLTGAFSGGRASITSIQKNHTRACFQFRSYFGGNCSTNNPVKAVMHDNLFKSQTQVTGYWGRFEKGL